MPVAPGASKEQRNGGLPVPRSYIVDQISYQRMNASCPDGKSSAMYRVWDSNFVLLHGRGASAP